MYNYIYTPAYLPHLTGAHATRGTPAHAVTIMINDNNDNDDDDNKNNDNTRGALQTIAPTDTHDD